MTTMNIHQLGKKIRIIGVCLRCRNDIMVEMDAGDYEDWINGFIKTQDIKGLTIDEREWLISQICGGCYDLITSKFGD